MDKVSQIRGFTFEKSTADYTKLHAGILAGEVEKVLPEVIYTDNDGYKSVAYGNMVGLLIEAIKELRQENIELRERVAALERNK